MAEQVLKTLESFVEKKLATGVSALITQEGKGEIFHYAGRSDLKTRRPFKRDTIMRMYSCSKPVTAVAIMTLKEKGILSMDTPISRFLPEWKDVKVCELHNGKPVLEPARREITVFDLLTMTSGIPYPEGGHTDDPVMKEVSKHYIKALRHIAAHEALGQRISTREVIRLMAGCPLCFHPGEKWKYGFSADVLGGLIVAATGMELGEYLKKTIFEPLAMKDTGFRVPKESEERLAITYVPSKAGLARQPKDKVLAMAEEGSFESGGGGLFSTVDDYTRFARMLLGEGTLDGVRILSPESVKEMAKDHLTEEQRVGCTWADEKGYGYGYLVRVLMDPKKTAYHESLGSFGWNGLAGTSIRIDPKRRTTLVFGVQRIPPSHDLFLPELTEAVEKDLGF